MQKIKSWEQFFKICAKYTFFIGFFCIFACSGKSSSSLSGDSSSQFVEMTTIPAWYLNPKKSNGLYLYGVGEGSSLQIAKKSALNDIASKLRTDISSTTTTTTTASNDYASNSLKQNITAKVQNVSFNNYDTSQTAVVSGRIYVEITVDKEKIIDEKEREIDATISKINGIIKNGDSFPNVLEKRMEYKKVFNLIPSLITNANLLHSLDAVGFDLKKTIDIATQFEKKYNELNSSMLFKIEDCDAKNAIKQILNKSSLKTVENNISENSGKNLVNVKCDVSTSYVEIYGKNYIKAQAIINFESGSKTLMSKTIVFNGSSSISKPEAVKNAFQNLADGIIVQDENKSKNDGMLKLDSLNPLDDDNISEKVLGF